MTEIVLGAELPSGVPDRAMKACVIRSLPDVVFVHIAEPRNLAVSDAGLGEARSAITRQF